MICLRCGNSADSIHTYSCQICGGTLMQNSTPQVIRTKRVSWEDAYITPYPLRSLIDTLQESLFNTDKFFKKVKNGGLKRNAWHYGLITGSIGILAAFIWSLVFPEYSYQFQNIDNQNYQTLMLAPLVISLQIVLSALYCHFMLVIFRTRNISFSSTFRVIAYAEGAMIFNAIPYIGSLLSLSMWLYLVISGIHQVHQISRWRVFAVLFIPLIAIFIFILFFIFAIAIGAMVAGGLSGQGASGL